MIEFLALHSDLNYSYELSFLSCVYNAMSLYLYIYFCIYCIYIFVYIVFVYIIQYIKIVILYPVIDMNP